MAVDLRVAVVVVVVVVNDSSVGDVARFNRRLVDDRVFRFVSVVVSSVASASLTTLVVVFTIVGMLNFKEIFSLFACSTTVVVGGGSLLFTNEFASTFKNFFGIDNFKLFSTGCSSLLLLLFCVKNKLEFEDIFNRFESSD